jgi:hypothetical protein
MRGIRMSRGKRPVVAIGNAKRKAAECGFLVMDLVSPVQLPFDFIAERDGSASRVRVRRLKQAGFRAEQILRSCRQPIREMRESEILKELAMELWVRGPGRGFHRYRVLPDTVEELQVLSKTMVDVSAPDADVPETDIPSWDRKPWNTGSGVIREIPYIQESPIKIERIRKILAGVREKSGEED